MKAQVKGSWNSIEFDGFSCPVFRRFNFITAKYLYAGTYFKIF